MINGVGTSLRRLMLAAVSTGLALSGTWAAVTAAAKSPRSEATEAMAANQKVAPGGIDELKAVEIGGIKQWISVRGNDPHNPILLYLHGGPGAPMMPESWTYQRPWEDFFTVVQWDQRGSGKTLTGRNAPIPSRIRTTTKPVSTRRARPPTSFAFSSMSAMSSDSAPNRLVRTQGRAIILNRRIRVITTCTVRGDTGCSA
jgi:hypothetical protein